MMCSQDVARVTEHSVCNDRRKHRSRRAKPEASRLAVCCVGPCGCKKDVFGMSVCGSCA